MKTDPRIIQNLLKEKMFRNFRFNRMEFAGSLGDLGTLLPISIAMIVINGLNPSGIFLSIALFYIFSGIYFGVAVPVQPMKVIGAYAIAMSLSASQIAASGLLISIFLLIIGGTGAITFLGKHIPLSVVRGVQVSTGTLLMSQGVKFVMGSSNYQTLQGAAEPYLFLQSVGPVPIGIIIGVLGGLITLFFLDSKKIPAGLLVIICGLLTGVFLGTHAGFDKLSIGFNLPEFLPSGFPKNIDLSFALIVLVLPQLPMTIGNAVIANGDLSKQYFGDDSKKVTYKALCFSMSLANFFTFFVGGMPLCHGAGGLAAHYRFGARTAGSNIMIGIIFIGLAVFLGIHALAIIHLIPFSILGILLIFAGSQLALTIIDVKERKDLFVSLVMLGITLAADLAMGFGVGIILAYILKSKKVSV